VTSRSGTFVFVQLPGRAVVAAWHLRRQGFVAAVGVHVWTDVVWHVVYGVL
jgi:hypothetical protein